MARDVHEIVVQVVQEKGKLTQEQALAYVKKMEVQKRYSADVWSWTSAMAYNSRLARRTRIRGFPGKLMFLGKISLEMCTFLDRKWTFSVILPIAEHFPFLWEITLQKLLRFLQIINFLKGKYIGKVLL